MGFQSREGLIWAALLGLTRFQLYSRLKRYGIDVSPE